MKKLLASMMEWIRPVGIVAIIFISDSAADDPVSRFHILGPFMVILMAGTVAFESLVLGETASHKIGYEPNRSYQIQSGLNNLATALTSVAVFLLGWGVYAEAAVVTVMLLFFILSSMNHARTAVRERNYRPVNLMRPIMTLLLAAFLIPAMIAALSHAQHV